MRRLGLIGTALLIVVVAVVATAPSSDADSPDWMNPMVEAGRASLLDNLDLIKPGSPLVLVSAQCREDGAVRLIYENRYLWVVHRRYYAEAAPGRVLGSMGGGVLHGSEDWLAGQAEVSCAESGLAAPSGRVSPTVCGPDEDCAQSFDLDGRLYFFSCRHVRPEAVDDYPYVAGGGEFEEVRRIPGLPPELFLAVRGRIACTPGSSDWWLAQTSSAVAELDPPLRDRLSDATEP